MSTESVTEQRFARMRPERAHDAPAVHANELPPGPPLPTILQSIGLLRFRHQFIPAMHRRYGDVFSIRILPEGRRLVVFNRPEHVKEIFAGDPEVFHAGKGNAILGPVMGEHSLLLVDGKQHKRARKLLMPAFNGHALRGYEALVTGLTKAEVGRWREGAPFESLQRMNALTLEVILQVVFGVTDETRLAQLRPLVNKTVNIPPLIFLGWGFPRLQKYGPWRRTIENQIELDRVIFAEIAERRQATDLADRSDVLSRLLQVRDEDAGRRIRGPQRRGAARPARHAPARGARDHCDGARLGAARARQGCRAGGEGARRRIRRRHRLPRGRAEGVDATPPGDPDGGAPPDGSRPRSAASTCRAAQTSRPRSCSPTSRRPATRTTPGSGRSGSSKVRSRRTPGSPSVAAYAGASARGSP